MKKFLAIVGGIVVAVYILMTAFVAVQETEIVVITLLGKPVRVIDEAGLVLKIPDPIQTAIRLDKRLQGLDSNLGEYLTKDKKNLVVGSYILWRVNEGKKFIQTVRDMKSAERRLSDLVGSELGAAIGTHDLTEFLSTVEGDTKIPQILGKVKTTCQGPAEKEFGIEIVDVRLRRLGFPVQNLRSVYDRMRAERARMAKKYRAEGEEEAAKIRAKTDKEVRELLANAYRDSQIVRGKGEAEAIRIYGDAFSKDPNFYKLTRTLKAYQKFLDDKTTLILSSESPLFRYLETPPEVR